MKTDTITRLQTRVHQAGVLGLVALFIHACSGGGGGGGGGGTDDIGGPRLPQAEGSWSVASPIPEGLQEIHAAVLKGQIYIAGGIDRNTLTTTSAYRYDPVTDSWSQIANLPEGRHHMPLAVANDTLYAVGGLSTGVGSFLAHNNLWLYDEAGDQWLERAELPRPRGASSAGVVSGQVIVAGGYDQNTRLIDSIAIYDPASDAWRSGAPMPTPRDHLAGSVVNNRFYLIGGRSIFVDTTVDVVEAYDLAADSWVTLAGMPTARGGLGAAALGSRIFALGGEPTPEMLRANEAYDVLTDTWAFAPLLPTGRHGLGVAAVGANLFAVGGGPVAGFAQTSVVEIFTPAQ